MTEDAERELADGNPTFVRDIADARIHNATTELGRSYAAARREPLRVNRQRELSLEEICAAYDAERERAQAVRRLADLGRMTT